MNKQRHNMVVVSAHPKHISITHEGTMFEAVDKHVGTSDYEVISITPTDTDGVLTFHEVVFVLNGERRTLSITC